MPEHAPQFNWHEDDGEGRIYDGETSVAAFHAGSQSGAGEPYRPVSLHDLRLVPGGPTAIAPGELCGPLCLSWRKHLIFDMGVDELRVDDSDPEQFELFVRTRDVGFRRDQPEHDRYRPDNVVEETRLELTYESDLRSYVFEVSTSLEVQPGREEFVADCDKRGLEFGDLLPAGANDDFPPRGDKKYQYVVYKSDDGYLYHRPQNKHMGPDKDDIRYAPDGFLAYVAEPACNPVVEFTNGSGTVARSEICWAMYDIHFKLKRGEQQRRLDAGEPLEVSYKLYSLPETAARDALDRSVPDPVLEHPQARTPAFEEDGVNTFDPSREYREPSDQWFWQCSDPSCRWSWDVGFGGDGCLTIKRESSTIDPPYHDALWFDMFEYSTDGRERSQWTYPRLRGDRGHEVSATVRTEDVNGEAYVAVEYPGGGSDGVQLSDQRCSGTTDWTDVEMVASPPQSGADGNAGLFLALEGSGECWFDDVEVTPR